MIHFNEIAGTEEERLCTGTYSKICLILRKKANGHERSIESARKSALAYGRLNILVQVTTSVPQYYGRASSL